MKVSNLQIHIIYNISNRFAMFFDLKVNVAKLKVLFFVTTKRSEIDWIVSNTCIKQTLTLDKYLSFPMLHGHIQRKDFEFLGGEDQ